MKLDAMVCAILYGSPRNRRVNVAVMVAVDTADKIVVLPIFSLDFDDGAFNKPSVLVAVAASPSLSLPPLAFAVELACKLVFQTSTG